MRSCQHAATPRRGSAGTPRKGKRGVRGERKKSGGGRLGWPGRGCRGRNRLDFFLEDLEEWAKIVVVFGTIIVAIAAVAVLVIGAFVDLPWV
jgi:hypothetical protein